MENNTVYPPGLPAIRTQRGILHFRILGGKQMNRNDIKIDFRINGKHDHFIEPKHGRSIPKSKATKKKYRFKKEVKRA